MNRIIFIILFQAAIICAIMFRNQEEMEYVQGFSAEEGHV